MTLTAHLAQPSILATLGEPLHRWLVRQRWFSGKARTIEQVEVADAVVVGDLMDLLADVSYTDGGSERYQVPVVVRPDATGDAVIARHEDTVLADASADPEGCRILLELLLRDTPLPTTFGATIVGNRVTSQDIPTHQPPRRLAGEQSNTSVVFGQDVILKVFRRVEAGINPDVELTRGLTEANFPHTPRQHASLQLVASDGTSATLAVLSDFTPSGRDGFDAATEEVATLVGRGHVAPAMTPDAGLLVVRFTELGAAVAELHATLSRVFGSREAVAADVIAWARQFHDQMRAVLDVAGRQAPDRLGPLRERQAALTATTAQLYDLAGDMEGVCPVTRIHGDLHLGQVLALPDHGWQILDFEGEPARSPSQRRAPQSPVRDVAGMLRSFDYAAAAGSERAGSPGGADIAPPAPAAAAWRDVARDRFLDGYRARAGVLTGVPHLDAPVGRALLKAFELDKAVYELGYELANRPSWVPIPVGGILRLLDAEHDHGTVGDPPRGARTERPTRPGRPTGGEQEQ